MKRFARVVLPVPASLLTGLVTWSLGPGFPDRRRLVVGPSGSSLH